MSEAPQPPEAANRPATDRWQDLLAAVRAFRDARDWAQFHTPKNLAAALAIEAAELQECFLWKADAEIEAEMAADPRREAVAEELADVLMFALLLADRLNIDPGQAIAAKLAINERKYPVALARGSARKYTELGGPPPEGGQAGSAPPQHPPAT
jgi:NTP pyrophosphatase (non-canonical NTP hydrolase)